jgi:hypothetical protein
MTFQTILTNWKTSLGGVIILVIAVLQLAGVNIPLIPHIDFGTAFMGVLTGLGFLGAKDANVTGGTTPNA